MAALCTSVSVYFELVIETRAMSCCADKPLAAASGEHVSCGGCQMALKVANM